MLASAQQVNNLDDFYSKNFRSPSGNIICGGDTKKTPYGRKQWSGVSCLIAISNDPIKKRPQECEQDWGGMFTLSRSGETDMECYGDFPFKVNADILPYGKTIMGDGWKCTSKKTGMHCINQDGRGFKIRRNQQILF